MTSGWLRIALRPDGLSAFHLEGSHGRSIRRDRIGPVAEAERISGLCDLGAAGSALANWQNLLRLKARRLKDGGLVERAPWRAGRF